MTGEKAQKIYRCDLYNNYGICQDGCVRPKRWRVDCYECWGQEYQCEICGGSGSVVHVECPRSYAHKFQWLLPYFFTWRANNCASWPDGKGTLYQPTKLKAAFDLLLTYYMNKEEKDSKRNASST